MSTVKGTGGIVNVGFTCYANAVIQAFRQYPKIETLFKEGNYNTILKSGCKFNELTEQFANMVQTLSTLQSKSSIRPMGFWRAFSEASQNGCFEHLVSREPHDAHEFLMFILDSLHESLSRTVNMNITNCELKTERQKSHQKSLESWKQNFEKQFSPFVDMFFGMFHIQIVCSECKNVSHMFETFNTLKGILPENLQKPTLLECLKGDLNDETIEGYQCDNCKKHTKASRKTRVWKLPQNLIVVLKRFTYDGRKISKPIEHVSTILSLETLYSELSPNKKDSNYTALSTVDHHGSAHGGHYTTQGLHNSEHKWYLYDDQSVHQIDNPKFGETTYIIFLTKL
jgi:ubiquitin C-terminal hydrolase